MFHSVFKHGIKIDQGYWLFQTEMAAVKLHKFSLYFSLEDEFILIHSAEEKMDSFDQH